MTTTPSLTRRPPLHPQIQRLVDHVANRALHRNSGIADPRDWLVQWLSTPQEALNGRKPASYLADQDCDLILVGLLIRAQTASAWDAHAQADISAHASTAIRNRNAAAACRPLNG